jgi:hypothetical protein
MNADHADNAGNPGTDLNSSQPTSAEPSGGRGRGGSLWVWAFALLLLGSIAVGWVQGPRAGVLLIAAGALASTIALFWTSLRALVGETPLTAEDAYALAVPRAEEEQKRAVLRAIKDLEFERSVGKINEEDFRTLTAKYRAEAKRLLQLLDEGAADARALAERSVEARLRQEGLVSASSEDEVGTSSAELPS